MDEVCSSLVKLDELGVICRGAQDPLDYVAAQYPSFTACGDGEAHGSISGAINVEGIVSNERGEHLRGMLHRLDVLFEQAVNPKFDHPEGWYGVELHRRFDVALAVDDEGHVVRHVCAVIDRTQAGRIPEITYFDLELPVEAHDVRRRDEGTLRDRVRFASYLVALYSDAIRFLGFDDAVRRRLGRNLRVCVGVLRELVRLPREPCASAGDHEGERSND